MDVRFVSDEGIEQHPVGELEQLLARDDGLVWVDIPVCDQEAAQVLAEVFGFHPLAIRACVERNAVPKVRAYRDHIFVILHAPKAWHGRPRPLHRARPVHRPPLCRDRPWSREPGGPARGRRA